MRVNRVALKEAADEHYLGREQMQPRRNGFGVFAQNARAFFQNFNDALIAICRRFTNHRSKHRDFHFVRRLRPTHELIEIIERKCAQEYSRQIALRRDANRIRAERAAAPARK